VGFKLSQIFRNKIFFFIFIFFLVFSIFSSSLLLDNSVKAIEPVPYYEPIERFGITVPYPSGVESLIESINVRAVLDWRINNTSLVLPENVEYIHVIRVSDAAYGEGALLDTLPDIIRNNLGDVWIIGNEPDRFCYQDSVNPEVYADRYFNIATLIRSIDNTAKLGFGSIVQPTPIRIQYLQRAIDKLIEKSGNNRANAMALIDIWSIHAFILNEHPYEWGAGIPVGFYTYPLEDVTFNRIPAECFTGEVYENDWSKAIKITNFSETYSIDIFTSRILQFRQWMNSIGERNKPLWITEYGSLLPPIDPPCIVEPCVDYVNVSDFETLNFMTNTFHFLLYSTDPVFGLQNDDNHLVQRWFWYSLNDYRYKFGGTLFDPDNDNEITIVGGSFKAFTNFLVWENKIHLPLVIK